MPVRPRSLFSKTDARIGNISVEKSMNIEAPENRGLTEGRSASNSSKAKGEWKISDSS